MWQLLIILIGWALACPVAAQPSAAPARGNYLRQVRVLAGGTGNHADGPGSAARFYWPSGVALGPDSTLYVADSENHCIRRISPTGQVSTLAGGAGAGYADGLGRTARFWQPTDVAVDATGVVYVADAQNHCLRRISPDGQVTTLAGSPGEEAYADGPRETARFGQLGGLALDAAGTLYVTDNTHARVCAVSPSGQVRTLARSYISTEPDTGYVISPVDVAIGPGGTLYVADQQRGVLRMSADKGLQPLPVVKSDPAAKPWLARLAGLVVDPTGVVYTTEEANGQIWRLGPDGYRQQWAGVPHDSYTIPPPPMQEGPRNVASFNSPKGLALAPDGTLYVADAGNHRIRRLGSDGQVRTWAGTGNATLLDGRGTAARFNAPLDIAATADGTVYVADTYNHCIRKITPDGRVTTLAGTGQPGLRNGPGRLARFRYPTGVAVDRRGVVYVADRDNHCIRRISPTGQVTTVAGTGVAGFANGPARTARFRWPSDVVVAPDGTLYVADRGNGRVRRIRPDGQVGTLVRGGAAGSRESSSGIGTPTALALAANGTLYVGAEEETGGVLYAVSPAGRVRYVAGGGGDRWLNDGKGSEVTFGNMSGMVVDGQGRIYVAESNMHQIRRVTPAGVVSTVAHGAGVFGPAESVLPDMDNPNGLAMGPGGTIYLTNGGGNCILILK